MRGTAKSQSWRAVLRGVPIGTEQKSSVERSFSASRSGRHIGWRLGGAQGPERSCRWWVDLAEVPVAVDVDVLVDARRQVGDDVVADRVSFGRELPKRGVGINRVPGHHRVGDEVEALGLDVLVEAATVVELTPVGVGDPPPESVERFTLVELGVNSAALSRVVQLTEQ